MFGSRWRSWIGVGVVLMVLTWAGPVWARIDPYVMQYLKVTEPVELPLDRAGATLTVTPEELAEGKQLFQSACINCHVGGATLPDPRISLSLEDLAGATPPRDTIAALMDFQRDPSNYTGDDVSFGCRQVSPAWMPDNQLQQLAAFVLRAAQKAPGWGIAEFPGGEL